MKLIYSLAVVFCCSISFLQAQNSLDFIAKGEEVKVVYTKGDKISSKKAALDPSAKGMEAGYKINVDNSYLSIDMPANATSPIFKFCCFNNSPLGPVNDACFKIEYNAPQEVQLKFSFFYYAEEGDEKESKFTETVTLPQTYEDKYLLFDVASKFKGGYKGIFYFFVEQVTPLKEAGTINIKKIHIGKK